VPKKKSLIDEVVAGAYGLAAFHFQNALLTALVAKGLFTMKEAVLAPRGAAIELQNQRKQYGDNQLAAIAQQALDNKQTVGRSRQEVTKLEGAHTPALARYADARSVGERVAIRAR
jgi:hypothetical protein